MAAGGHCTLNCSPGKVATFEGQVICGQDAKWSIHPMCLATCPADVIIKGRKLYEAVDDVEDLGITVEAAVENYCTLECSIQGCKLSALVMVYIH